MHVVNRLDSPPRPEPAYAECSPGTAKRENKLAESAQKADTQICSAQSVINITRTSLCLSMGKKNKYFKNDWQ